MTIAIALVSAIYFIYVNTQANQSSTEICGTLGGNDNEAGHKCFAERKALISKCSSTNGMKTATRFKQHSTVQKLTENTSLVAGLDHMQIVSEAISEHLTFKLVWSVSDMEEIFWSSIL